MNIDRTLLKQLKDLKHLSRDRKHELINKIPNKYLMKVLGNYGDDSQIIDFLTECDKLASNIELCKALDKNYKKVQKTNFSRANILVKYLIKKRKINLLTKELISKYG